jgi:hypothetical protein
MLIYYILFSLDIICFFILAFIAYLLYHQRPNFKISKDFNSRISKLEKLVNINMQSIITISHRINKQQG